MVDKKDVANIFPLTPLQEGILYRTLASGGGEYIMQSRLRLSGALDTESLEEAWNLLIARHEALRMLVAAEGAGRPLQVVLKQLRITIPVTDLSAMQESERAAVVDTFCRGEMDSGFALKHPPLLRLSLFRFSPLSHLLVMTFHHIIMDGWCQGILHDELIACYRAARSKSKPELPPAPLFSSYVRYLSGIDSAAGVSFWQAAMEGYEPGGETSWMKEPSVQGSRYELRRCEFTLDSSLTDYLRDMAAGCGTTLNAAIQTLWGAALCRLSGKRDVAWGTVVSGRPPDLPRSDRTIGLFINTIPVRFRMEAGLSFRDALKAMGGFLSASMSHQNLPLAEVQRACGAQGGLFDHLLIFENYPVSPEDATGRDGLSIMPETPLEGYTDYDLVFVVDAGDEIGCCIKYNAAVLRDDDICLVRDAFNALAEDVSIDPDKSLDDVRILPPVVLHHVIDVFPAGEDIASDGLTFPALFAAQVRKCPDRTAVEAVDGVLTYRELDAASDAVACELLTTAGVVPGERVALMTGRDRWMIPGIIGIMKASAVFVPLDPDYPDDRIRFILEDCGCRTVIVSGENGLRFTGYPNLTVLDARRAVGSAQNLPYDRLPECGDPAYVIYTSGSTGQPKGVMVGHQALANFIRGYTYSVLNCHNGPLRIAFVAKYIFDAAGRAFYPSLCRGDTVCVVDEETRLDGAALLRFLAARSIDLFDGTPSLCSLAIEGGDRIDTLRQVVLGGEALKQSLVDRIRTAFPQAAVTNVYGPTETTIDSTFHHVDLSPGRDWNILPIGRPLPNQRVYVLDDLLHPLPVGAVGEICIGGKGVADGYLNREDLTGERFVTDPFNPGGMLYRTGDLGRWEREGNLIFLGRRDSQVKVRGFRIEPGEIEAAISSMAEIKWCAIVPKSDSEDAVSLYAFYEGSLTPREMRRKLRLTLPAHMIPDHFMAVDRIPLTATGKIDRRALSELTGTEPVRAAVTITSTSETERRMIASMGRILGRVDISGEDNFFEIGGHSLLAARLASNIAASMGKRLPISAIYRFPTPAELADFFTRYDPELNGFLGEFRFHFNEASEVLYCFPPYGATGIIYHPLARHLDRWRLECFNFLADGGFVRDAVRAILPSAQKSPVNILGYSGGGNLAFEVTREIENRGGRVGRIIMLDTYCRLETADVSPQRHQLEMEGIVASAEYSVFFPDAASKTAAVRNGTAYAAYLYSGIDTGMIKSPISIICADDETPDPVRDRYGALRSRNGWKNLTHASFECVRGSGSHDEMVNEKNCAYNSALIRKFLSDHQG